MPELVKSQILMPQLEQSRPSRNLVVLRPPSCLRNLTPRLVQSRISIHRRVFLHLGFVSSSPAASSSSIIHLVHIVVLLLVICLSLLRLLLPLFSLFRVQPSTCIYLMKVEFLCR